MMDERKLLAVSIKHTEWKWKFGKPCVLWGHRRTADGEKRCFAGYTENPYQAELYSLRDWQESGYGGTIVKLDETVKMEINFCKKYRKYDTVLVLYDDYLCYCKACGFSYENKDGDA